MRILGHCDGGGGRRRRSLEVVLVGAHKVLASGKVVELLDTLLIEERDVAVLGDELVNVRVKRVYVGCDVCEAVYVDEELQQQCCFS